MIQEFEIGMNALSLDTLMYEWSDTVKLGYYEYLIVKAEVEQQYYRGEEDGLDIDIIAIDGKEIVSIDQSFEDEIKNKICEAI